MTWADLRLRLRALLFRGGMEQELDEELRQHIELETRNLVASGMPVEQAQRRARVSFGGLEQTKEACRDSRRVTWLTDLLLDVSYALRTFQRAPGFVAVIVLMLGFGIGINTAAFGIVDAILLKMLPVRDPGTLFRTVPISGQAGDIGTAVSYRIFREMQNRAKPLADLMGYQLPHKTAVSLGRSQPQYLERQVVSGNYFSVLGVKAVVGRMIGAADGEEPGKHPVAVISSRLWNDRFQRSPNVIGKKLQLDNRTFDIVGAAPSQFFGVEVGAVVDVWTPVSMAPAHQLTNDHSGWLQLMGRRKPGVSLAQAAAPLQAVWEAAMIEDVRLHAPPGTPKQIIEHFLAGTRLKAVPAGGGISYLRGRYGRALQIVMFIVALVLLITCTNAAGLMIARGTSRQHEMAVRQSLGAGRLRLLRQLLTESTLLTLLSGVLGLLISHWATPVIVRSLAPGSSPIELAVRTDARMLCFTAGVAFLSVLVFGLFPALRFSKTDAPSSLQSGAGQTRDHRGIAGRTLIVSQVAISFVLLVGSVLFTRTLWNLMSSTLGFNPQHVVVADLAEAGSQPEQKLLPAWAELLREIKQLPGVESCSLSSSNLFSESPRVLGVRVTEAASRPIAPTSDLLAISSNYFRTMGIRLITGRDLGPGDRNPSSPSVAIVNESFAHKFFGNADPIGQKITRLYDKPEWAEIIGVVQNTKVTSVRKAAPPMVYVPYERMADWFPPQMQPGRALSLQVRGRQDANTLASLLREKFQDEFAVQQITTQAKLIDDTLRTEELLAGVSNLFGGLALALTALGLYGAMSYAVARRRQEMGIRMALGATPGRMLVLILRESAIILLVGLPIGVGLALASTHTVRSLLYGVPPNGWVTFVIVGAVVLIISLPAAFVPAYRVTKIGPAIALRYE